MQLNEALFESAAQANKYGNMMGPVIGNIGNLQFVLTAVLGGIPFCYRNWRYHTWRYGFLPAVHQELYTAFYAGGAAV